MTLNGNVNIGGDIFLEGDDYGISFSDGSRQITAATPSLHQIMPAAECFGLVIKNYEAVLGRKNGLVWQKLTSDTTCSW